MHHKFVDDVIYTNLLQMKYTCMPWVAYHLVDKIIVQIDFVQSRGTHYVPTFEYKRIRDKKIGGEFWNFLPLAKR